MTARKILSPPPIATQAFTDASAAVARLEQVYERNTAFLRERFEASHRQRHADGPCARDLSIRADHHPELCTARLRASPTALSAGPGVHETTVTRA